MASKLESVKKWEQNFRQSLKYSAERRVKDKLPAIVEIHDMTQSEYARELRQKSRTVNSSSIRTTLNNLSIIRDAGIAWKNTLSDLKSGKLYNKAREDQQMEKQFKEQFGDFDLDFDEKSFDDDSDMSFEKMEDNAIRDLSDDINSGFEASTKTLSTAITAGNTYISENIKASAQLTYSQLTNISKINKLGFEGVANNLRTLIEFNKNELKQHIENSAKFYQSTTNFLAEQNAMMKEMVEMQRNLYKQAQSQAERPTGRFSDINRDGAIDLEEYVKAIKKNFSNSTIGSMYEMMQMTGGVGGMMASPLSFLSDAVISTMMGPKLEKSLMKLNKTSSNIFGAAMNKFNNMADNGGILSSFIGELLGIRSTEKKTIDTSKFTKGPMAYNGIANKTLVEVIPGYLRRIEAALTGGEERIFNMETGKWTTVGAARKEFKQKRNQGLEYALSDMMTYVRPQMENISFKNRSGAIDHGARDSFYDDMASFMRVVAKDNGSYSLPVDRHGKLANKKSIMKKYGIRSEKNMDMIVAIMNAVPGYARMNTIGNIREWKDSRNEYMNQIESIPGSAATLFFNNAFGDDNLKKLKDKYKRSGKASDGKQLALFQRSQNMLENNSILSALQGIYIENHIIRTMLETGSFSGGTKRTGRTAKSSVKGGDRHWNQFIRKTGGTRVGLKINDKEKASVIGVHEWSKPRTSSNASVDYYGDDPISAILMGSGKINEQTFEDTEYSYDGFGEGFKKQYQGMKGKGFVQKFKNAKGAQKPAAILGALLQVRDKPAEILAGMVDAVNNSIYHFFFKTKSEIVDEKGNKVEGFFNTMAYYTKTMFKDTTKYLYDHVLKPLNDAVDAILEHFPTLKKVKDRATDTFKRVGRRVQSAFGSVWNDIAGDTVVGAKADGGYVKKTGLYALSKGEAVIPGYLNPYNPHMESSDPREDAKREAKIIAKAKKHGFRIEGQYADGTSRKKAVEDAKKYNKAEESETKDAIDKLKEMAPEVFGEGGVLGGIAGFMATGGPMGVLAGAAIGSGIMIAKRSEKVQEWLYGKIDDKGQRQGGLMNSELVKKIKPYAKSMKEYGIVGTALGFLTPLGAVGGLLLGGAIGFAKENDKVKEFFFGKDDSKRNEVQRFLINHRKRALAGAGIGFMSGMALAGPFGAIGGLLIGSGISFATTTDKFKEMMLGKEDPATGKRVGGVYGVLRDTIIDPLGENIKNMEARLEVYMKRQIFDPISRAFKPFGQLVKVSTRNMFNNLQDRIATSILGTKAKSKLLQMGRNGSLLGLLGGGIGAAALGLGPLGALAVGLGGAALTKTKAGRWALGGLSRLPGNIAAGVAKRVGKIGDRVQQGLIASGEAENMSATERLAFMKDKNYKYANLDAALINTKKSDLQDMQATLQAHLGNRKAFDARMTEARADFYNITNNSSLINPKDVADLAASGNLQEAIDKVEDSDLDRVEKNLIIGKLKNAHMRLSKFKDQEKNSAASVKKITSELGLNPNNKNDIRKALRYLNTEIEGRGEEVVAPENDPETITNKSLSSINESLFALVQIQNSMLTGKPIPAAAMERINKSEEGKTVVETQKAIDEHSVSVAEEAGKEFDRAAVASDEWQKTKFKLNPFARKMASMAGANYDDLSKDQKRDLAKISTSFNPVDFASGKSIIGAFKNIRKFGISKTANWMRMPKERYNLVNQYTKLVGQCPDDIYNKIKDGSDYEVSGLKALLKDPVYSREIKDIDVFSYDPNELIDLLDTLNKASKQGVGFPASEFPKLINNTKALGVLFSYLREGNKINYANLKRDMEYNGIKCKVPEYQEYTGKTAYKDPWIIDTPGIESHAFGGIIGGIKGIFGKKDDKKQVTAVSKGEGIVKGVGKALGRGLLSGLKKVGNFLSPEAMALGGAAIGAGKGAYNLYKGFKKSNANETRDPGGDSIDNGNTKTVSTQYGMQTYKRNTNGTYSLDDTKANQEITDKMNADVAYKNKVLQLLGALVAEAGINPQAVEGQPKEDKGSFLDDIMDGAKSGLPWIAGGALLGAKALWKTIRHPIRSAKYAKLWVQRKFNKIKRKFRKGVNFAKELPGKVANAGRSALDKLAKFGEGVKGKVMEGISKFRSGLSKIMDIAAKYIPKNLGNKVATFCEKIMTKITNPKTIEKACKNLATKGAAKAVGQVAGTTGIGLVLTAGVAMYLFYDGYSNAAEYFKIKEGDEPSLTQKLVAGLANAITVGIPVAGLFLDGGDIISIASAVFGSDIMPKSKGQEKDAENGTEDSKSEPGILSNAIKSIQNFGKSLYNTAANIGSNILDFGKDAFASIWSKISGLGDSLSKGAASLWKSIKDKFQGAIPNLKIDDNSFIGKGIQFAKDVASYVGDKIGAAKKWIFGGSKYGRGNVSPYAFASQITGGSGMQYNTPGDTQYQTLADSGCGPGAASNAIASLGGQLPIEAAAKYALDKGFKEKDGGTKPGFFTSVFNQMGLKTDNISSNNQAIESNLKKGYPVVLMGKDSRVSADTPYGPGVHYVTATGYDNNGNIIIQDSESDGPNKTYDPMKVLNKSTIAIAAKPKIRSLAQRKEDSDPKSKGRYTGKSKFGRYKYAAIKFGQGFISRIPRPKWGLGKGSRWGRGADNPGPVIWDLLHQVGFNDIGAAGVMGNMMQESTLNPSIVQGGGTAAEITVDGKTGYGLCQWTDAGRQQGLADFAKQNGVKTSDPGLQCSYIVKEMPGIVGICNNADNASSAAYEFHKEFEKSADGPDEIQQRMDWAEEAYRTKGIISGADGSISSSGVYSGGANGAQKGPQYSGLFGFFDKLNDELDSALNFGFGKYGRSRYGRYSLLEPNKKSSDNFDLFDTGYKPSTDITKPVDTFTKKETLLEEAQKNKPQTTVSNSNTGDAIMNALSPLSTGFNKIKSTFSAAMSPLKGLIGKIADSPIGKMVGNIFGDNPFSSLINAGKNIAGKITNSLSNNPNIRAASQYANSRVGTEGYGNTGCTAWVNDYLTHAGVKNIDLWTPNAMQNSINNSDPAPWKTPDQGAVEGDIALIDTNDNRSDGPDHVVVADGQGGYWGNSSSRNQIVHSNLASDWGANNIYGYIGTGGVGNGFVSSGDSARTVQETAGDSGAGKYGRSKYGLSRRFLRSIYGRAKTLAAIQNNIDSANNPFENGTYSVSQGNQPVPVQPIVVQQNRDNQQKVDTMIDLLTSINGYLAVIAQGIGNLANIHPQVQPAGAVTMPILNATTGFGDSINTDHMRSIVQDMLKISSK